MAGSTASTDPPEIKSRMGAILRATSGNFLEQFPGSALRAAPE